MGDKIQALTRILGVHATGREEPPPHKNSSSASINNQDTLAEPTVVLTLQESSAKTPTRLGVPGLNPLRLNPAVVQSPHTDKMG